MSCGVPPFSICTNPVTLTKSPSFGNASATPEWQLPKTTTINEPVSFCGLDEETVSASESYGGDGWPLA